LDDEADAELLGTGEADPPCPCSGIDAAPSSREGCTLKSKRGVDDAGWLGSTPGMRTENGVSVAGRSSFESWAISFASSAIRSSAASGCPAIGYGFAF
jgi:hypothetical protein